METRHRFVFWQNINSIHWSAFLKALSEEAEVCLVTTEDIGGRARMGWHEPDLPGVRILRHGAFDWQSLIEEDADRTWHVFAGLAAFPKVHEAFRYAVRRHRRIGIYSESLERQGLLGVLKDIRGLFWRLRYGGSIRFVLCIGREARRQFRRWGFPEESLHGWSYVTEPLGDVGRQRPVASDKVVGIYPGSLSRTKGADLLIEGLDYLRHPEALELRCFSVDPEESDPERLRLMRRAEAHPSVRMMHFVENGEVLRQMADADFLILPSRYDGWGAVVNEALSVGTPVLASRSSGASELVEGRPLLGRVLDRLDPESIAAAIDDAVAGGRVEGQRRREIGDWASTHISGPILARHFIRLIANAALPLPQRMTAPWERQPSEGNTGNG